jgi:ATP-dependent Lon protease
VEDIDIGKAREILDADHFGLAKVKRRVLEYLAVRKLNADGRCTTCPAGQSAFGSCSVLPRAALAAESWP